MEHSWVQLFDLPDEMLMIIFKKLENIDVLYSLWGINTRFDKILHDSIFTSSLTLLKCLSNCFICPLPDTILDRFCLQILSQICLKIKWLDIESSSMERILLATEYSNLCGLGIYNITEDVAIRLFIDKTPLDRIKKNQVCSLVVTIPDIGRKRLIENTITAVCARVFTVFTNLHYLNIYSPDYMYFPRLSFNDELSTFFSATLTELHINLENSNDCLYLLDGRFNRLRVLYVNIGFLFPTSAMIGNKEELPNLRSFSLRCQLEQNYYDELIIPLLRRMSNLESLSLYLAHDHIHRFIDGNDLKKNIINHIPRLNKFLFNIRSIISLNDQMSLLSNNDIQRTFSNFTGNQIISCVDYFPKMKRGQCHAYSYPYTLNYYHNITNNFPGGLFKRVGEISLYDEHPFEYEFFIEIAQAFPCLRKLSLSNRKGQKLKNNNMNYPLIKYPHLNDLELIDIHKDYVELFLDNTKTLLSDNLCLSVEYRPLRKVTNNFKKDTMRFNCAKVIQLMIPAKFKISQRFKAYFPHVKISQFY
ncbi:unnamed protein product [Rotaria socialis]|uniref:F-box domain-containing protein n=1 Tax=Rotaria socialis TaxID=392032 RepID=A0A818R8B8_9BILA|nr:unnamed protein product [Rotaria socialis]